MNAVRFIQRETPVRAGRSGCTRLSRSLSALGRSLLYGTPLAAALFAGSASAEKVLMLALRQATRSPGGMRAVVALRSLARCRAVALLPPLPMR